MLKWLKKILSNESYLEAIGHLPGNLHTTGNSKESFIKPPISMKNHLRKLNTDLCLLWAVTISLTAMAITCTSCQKTGLVQRQLIIQQDTIKPTNEQVANARGGVKGSGKPPKPTTPVEPPTDDTTVIVNPPPIGSGYSCIKVDLDGENISSNLWNGGVSFNCSPSGLTSEQKAQVMSEVRALYTNYNVVITDDENVYAGANQYKRIRVVVTNSSSWYPYTSVSGVAYVGSFTWGDDTPAFVFSDRLYYLEHMIAEIVAHESGHTLGLYHQSEYDANCNLISRYKNGAVMGNSLNSPQGQWIFGTTSSCTTYQDDNNVLKQILGAK